MRGMALTRSFLMVGLVAFVGTGCEQLNTLLEEVQEHHGGTMSGTGAGGATMSTGSGGSVGSGEQCKSGPNGNGEMCTWCVDASGATTETCSGSAGTSGSAGAGGSTGTPPAGMCVEITEGGPGTCQDYGTWKIHGSDACAKQMLVISNLKPGPTCGTDGSLESMTYVCCAPATGPTCTESTGMDGRLCRTCVDPTGKVISNDCNLNVPGTMCVKIDDGGSSSCKDAGTWKQYGSDRCKQQNLQLTDIALGPTCGGGNYQSVTYVCCGTAPSGGTGMGGSPGTMPLPPKCGQTTDASGKICQTCWDPLTGKVISNDCSGGSTGTGGSSGSGGSMCLAIDDGGPTSCKDPETWKKYGTDACAQKNLTLLDVKVVRTCDGGYATVSYTCCGSAVIDVPPPAVTCESWMDANGAICKSCKDTKGNVVSSQCIGGTMPPNEICDVKTNADGSQCKTCYYSDGTSVSSCATP